MSKLFSHVALFPSEGDGHLCLLSPSPQCGLTFEEIVSKDIPKGLPRLEIARQKLPETGLLFFSAWIVDYEGKSISVDMEVAQEVTRDIIRELREPYFQKLDVSYMRASEEENTSRMKEVTELKQLLRDLPASPAIQEAKTPEELKRLAETSVQEAVAKSKDNKPVD